MAILIRRIRRTVAYDEFLCSLCAILALSCAFVRAGPVRLPRATVAGLPKSFPVGVKRLERLFGRSLLVAV